MPKSTENNNNTDMSDIKEKLSAIENLLALVNKNVSQGLVVTESVNEKCVSIDNALSAKLDGIPVSGKRKNTKVDTASVTSSESAKTINIIEFFKKIVLGENYGNKRNYFADKYKDIATNDKEKIAISQLKDHPEMYYRQAGIVIYKSVRQDEEDSKMLNELKIRYDNEKKNKNIDITSSINNIPEQNGCKSKGKSTTDTKVSKSKAKSTADIKVIKKQVKEINESGSEEEDDVIVDENVLKTGIKNIDSTDEEDNAEVSDVDKK